MALPARKPACPKGRGSFARAAVCGICGFVGSPRPDVLLRMRDALAHRGPDDAGSFHDPRVSLGVRRLAIIDLAGGRQPLRSADGKLVLVFNGEIYNHASLRAELTQAGHRYSTRADGESVLHAYDAWGDECLARLEGMFAFVLYDQRRQRLFGARDRFGEKPLYYTVGPAATGGLAQDSQGASFVFASELKSLRIHPLAARCRSLHLPALADYLAHDFFVGEESIWEGVTRLPPAHAFAYELHAPPAQALRRWRYWDLPQRRSSRVGSPVQPRATSISQRRRLLLDAVESRLMADVPVGVFLSGGIDSSTIVALMAQLRPAADIKTYSIGFGEPSFDESAYAAEVARHFGTDHHQQRFTTDDLLAQLPAVVKQFDEPLADPSILPFSALCEFASGDVKVALGGDGGDEAFAGYDPLRALAPARWYWRLVPGMVHRRCVVPLARRLPDGETNLNRWFVVKRFLRGALLPAGARLPAWMGAFDGPGLARLLPDCPGAWSADDLYRHELAAWEKFATPAGDFERAVDYFLRFYLPDDILTKVDRGSMLHSLEVRAPWLQLTLAEALGRAAPGELGPGKRWLKSAVSGGDGEPPLVPPWVVRRRKKGFGIPLAAWIRRDLRPQMEEMLVHTWPEWLDMIDHQEVCRLLAAHLAGMADHCKELWALFMLAHWAHEHGP